MRRGGAILAMALLAGSLGWLVAPETTPDLRPAPGRAPSGAVRGPRGPSFEAPPPAAPGALQFHDGMRWRSVYWASDEIRAHVRPGADPATLVPDARIEGWNGAAFTARVKSMNAEEFSRRALELRSREGVRDVLPVFYPSSRALESRSGPRLYLTTQVLATLPAGANAAALAARLGARLVASFEVPADTHLLQASDPFGAFPLAAALIETEGALAATPQFTMIPRTTRRRDTGATDPRYGLQWHLNGAEGVRAEVAWDYTFGLGSVISVIDTGTEYTHEDLTANYLAFASHDYDDNDSDPAPAPYQVPIAGNDINDDHGTSVAGVAAAARNNGVGGAGVAPQAQFGAIRLISQIGAPSGISDTLVASAMSFNNSIIHIKTNSWSFTGDGLLDSFPHFMDFINIASGWTTGRGGKGVIYLFAAGNSGDIGDDVNYSGYGTRRQVISVGATDNTGVRSFYSNPGAALLVCAPSDGGSLGIATTDRTGTPGYNTAPSPTGDYTENSGPTAFGGTSSATPLVAGVVALLLSANNSLSSRDVQHILVRTARKSSAPDPLKFTNGGGRVVSHNYGHGIVDAGAAVKLAKAFPYAKTEQVVTRGSGTLNLAIPDSPGPNGTTGGQVINTQTFGSVGALRIEHVEVVLNVTHTYIGDLRVRLVHTNPGTPAVTSTSVLANLRGQDSTVNYSNWQFMSTLHWGESSEGDWTLQIDDMANVDTGTFNNWTIRFYGTPIDVTAPVAGTVHDGPGADIAVQTNATAINANWTGFSDAQSNFVYEWAIGTTSGATDVQTFQSVPYATSASATGLSLSSGTTYYVTVRATNFEGLQTTATSNGVLVDTDAPLAPTSPSVTPSLSNTGDLHVSWSAPTDPGGSGVASYTVQRSVNGGAFSPIATVGTTSYDDLALGDGSYQYQIRAVDVAGNIGSFTAPVGPAVVDRTPPDTSITGKPPNPSGNANPTFTFSATEPSCTFSYQLDGGAVTSNGTTTSVPLLGLAPGSHTFQVFATDPAGNVDATPASYTWNIPRIVADTTAPFLNSFDSSLAFSNWTVMSTGAPTWAVDATPGTILGSAPAFASAPSSLNYNNGNTYQTGAVANSGTATSPLIDLTGLPATGWLRFMCNYDTDTTGTATDKRIVKIMSPDLLTTRDTIQFSGSGASPVGCGAAGAWHEHAIPFNAAWLTTFKLQIIFDTVDGNANTGAGWFIDDLEFSDLLVAGLNQYSAGVAVPIAIGASAADSSLEFRGLISRAATGFVKVEVEVQPVGTAFTGTATGSVQGSAGAIVTIATPIAATGNYRWRARTQVLPAGLPSGWMEFGANPAGDTDFQVTSLAGAGGGGGGSCGMTGLEWIVALGVLRMFGRRRR